MLSSSSLCMCYGVAGSAVSPLDQSPDTRGTPKVTRSGGESAERSHTYISEYRIHHPSLPCSSGPEHSAVSMPSACVKIGSSSVREDEPAIELPELQRFIASQFTDNVLRAVVYVAILHMLSMPPNMHDWTSQHIAHWITEDMSASDLEDLGLAPCDSRLVLACRDLYLSFVRLGGSGGLRHAISATWGSSESLSDLRGVTPLTGLSSSRDNDTTGAGGAHRSRSHRILSSNRLVQQGSVTNSTTTHTTTNRTTHTTAARPYRVTIPSEPVSTSSSTPTSPREAEEGGSSGASNDTCSPSTSTSSPASSEHVDLCVAKHRSYVETNQPSPLVYGQLILLGRLDKGSDDDSHLPPSVFAAQASRFVLSQKDSTCDHACVSARCNCDCGVEGGMNEWTSARGTDSPKRLRRVKEASDIQDACRECGFHSSDYVRVRACDVFQLGRDACASNDFIITTSQSTSTEAYRPTPNPGVPSIGSNWAPHRQLSGNHINSSAVNGSSPSGLHGPPMTSISRYAFRIEVERQYPHRAFILASGFDQQRNIYVPKNSAFLPSEDDGNIDLDEESRVPNSLASIIMRTSSRLKNGRGKSSRGRKGGHGTDAITAIGVRLWSPAHRDWVEISVQGNVFEPRIAAQQPGRRRADRTNELVSGSIIDIGGAYLLFQHQRDVSTSQASGTAPSAAAIIASINSKRPQCPVLMRSLQLEYCSTRDRLLQSLSQSLCQECQHGSCNLQGRHRHSSAGTLHSFLATPASVSGSSRLGQSRADCEGTTLAQLEDEAAVQPYVFTACGHVHSYSKELAGRPCPMCRASSEFVPLKAPFCTPICRDEPTHVFNPCGHAASEEVCRFWASFPLVKTHFSHENSRRPACPFCLKFLVLDARCGGPFNRLIFQFDSYP